MCKINFLGTGSAMVTKCFNTCFTISDENNEHFLVDTGGGNLILTNLEKARIPLNKIHNMFLSHSHNDHINGISWIIRAIASEISNEVYEGNLNVYGHKEVLETAKQLCTILLSEKNTKFFDNRIKFIEVTDKFNIDILDFNVTFFNINSSKLKQFGFTFKTLDNKKVVFLGDEGYKDDLFDYCNDVDYLIHEAFCLYEQKDIYSPHEKHHSTVKDAAEISEKLGVKNLILIHTEDDNLANKKEFYSAEANYFFRGNVFVPKDLETISLVDEVVE